MKRYRAEFHRRNETGRECCTADTITDLLVALTLRGYEWGPAEMTKLLRWATTHQSRFWGLRLTVEYGEPQMTEYTSF